MFADAFGVVSGLADAVGAGSAARAGFGAAPPCHSRTIDRHATKTRARPPSVNVESLPAAESDGARSVPSTEGWRVGRALHIGHVTYPRLWDRD